MRPEDHAMERIDWIASWVLQLPEDKRQYWIGLLNCAYSRYYGKEISVVVGKGANGEAAMTKEFSENNYIEGYIMHAAARDVDYSNFTFLKDLELHGTRGVLVQGPIVPLSS